MKLVLALLGMAFALSVGLLAIGAVVSILAIFFGYPVGWAIATSFFCCAYARNGMNAITGRGGVNMIGVSDNSNSDGAFYLLHILAFVLVFLFASSSAPYNISAFWALLAPLLVIPAILISGVVETLLDMLNPNGRRP